MLRQGWNAHDWMDGSVDAWLMPHGFATAEPAVVPETRPQLDHMQDGSRSVVISDASNYRLGCGNSRSNHECMTTKFPGTLTVHFIIFHSHKFIGSNPFERVHKTLPLPEPRTELRFRTELWQYYECRLLTGNARYVS